MTRRRPIMLAVALVTGLLVGCATSEPQPFTQPSWAVGSPRETVVAIADDLKDAYIAAYPDLNLTPEGQVLEPRSSDCSGQPAPTGERIQWHSGWSLRLEPAQETVPLLGKVIDQLTSEGWILRDKPSNSESVRELDRDGYYLRITGDYEADGSVPARIWFTAHSPCVDNPDK